MVVRGIVKAFVLVTFCCITSFMVSPIAAELSSIRHNLQVRLIPHQNFLQATDLIELEGAGILRFMLASELSIHQAYLNGKSTSVEGKDGRWSVDLGSDGAHKLELRYSGTFLPDSASGASIHNRSERPVIGSDASYLPSGSGWYPELKSGPFTYQLSVSLPKPHKAVAPGLLVAETEDDEKDGNYQARFDFTDPTWGIPLFAGPYHIREYRHDSYLLRTYFFEELETLSDDYLELSKGYLKLFSDRIGPYPFHSFHIVAARLPVGLGFPGLTYIGQHVLRLPFIKHSSLGHEVLHNWWGNGVYIDYEKGNWAEGLTTYMADYYFLEQKSSEMAKARRLEWLRDYAALPAERDQPPRTFISKTHTASQVIGYHKVAFLFHMLSRQLSKPVFESALRRFWQEQRFKIAGWDELENTFSEEADKNLSGFFAQWLDRTGAPEISFAKVSKSRQENDVWLISLEIRQSEPPYQLQVPVRVKTGEGWEEHLIAIKDTHTLAEIELSAEPVELVADPDFNLFRRLAPYEAPPTLRDTLLNGQTQTLVLGDTDFQQQALILAQAMLDSSLQATTDFEPEKPLLLIGPSSAVDTFLRTHELPGMPEELSTPSSSAQVWARRTSQGQPYVVVAANNLRSLKALLRPLPHYGRRGYLMFQGSKAVVKGNWPISQSGIFYRFP